MNSTPTQVERAKDSTGNKKAEDQKDFKAWVRPPRRRPSNFQAEAVVFLDAALKTFDEKKIHSVHQIENWLPLLFRNYCLNTGLRGKQKESTWRAVRILIQEAKSAESAISKE